MNRLRLALRYGLAPVLLGFVILLPGCAVDPGYHGPPPHYHYFPHHHDYYYYPSARVYFHFTTGTYYYFDGGIWIKSKVLPPQIYIDARHRVMVRVESGPPYSRYKRHAEMYKPGPGYRPGVEANRQERDANRHWYENYRKNPPGRKP